MCFVTLSNCVQPRECPFQTTSCWIFSKLRTLLSYTRLWAFFAMAREIEALLGRPIRAVRPKTTELETSIPWEYEIAWKTGVRLLFNPRFSRGHAEERFSYSLPLRPDMALEAVDGANAGQHLFDAKFRIDWIESALTEAESAQDEDAEELLEERVGTFKRADLYKMHVYRDAIPAARSVWILYPGNKFRFFPQNGVSRFDDAFASSELDGVGAIPVKPGSQPSTELQRVVRLLLGSPLTSNSP